MLNVRKASWAWSAAPFPGVRHEGLVVDMTGGTSRGELVEQPAEGRGVHLGRVQEPDGHGASLPAGRERPARIVVRPNGGMPEGEADGLSLWSVRPCRRAGDVTSAVK